MKNYNTRHSVDWRDCAKRLSGT